MGAALDIDIAGKKGGSSKAKTPTEAPDSLQSIAKTKLLIAVGEGEFDGTPTAQDIYLDNTPLADADGNLQFEGVDWEWRPGSVDQDYIPGLPSIENDISLNLELRSGTPWVRAISNTELSAVRLRLAWPALQQQDTSGNVKGYVIEYAVDLSTDGGPYQEVLAESVDGKTTTRYERSRRIDLPAAESGWQIRVRRLTANQNSARYADTMLIAGLAEVIDAKLSYPNTALLYVEFSAEQFSNVPAVTVECDARRVQVPSNYDPRTRTYSGVWDGSMKEAWTDNPAWHTFDVSTNDRFGVGRRIKPWMVDKWELYRIAQWCDGMVSDGQGGTEPRHTCNLNLQSRSDAWQLLRDISAIYRGMTYWAQGQLKVQADIPREADFDYVFTRANVIDGQFTRGSASVASRYSRALVSYDNPANNYDTDVVPVTDKRLQRRYGDKPVEISAIGCTRASEAQRRGKWVLLTNSQDATVTFRTSVEGVVPLPGYVIPIANSLVAGREIGGRISAVDGRTVTLDRDTQAKAGDRLILNLPSGQAEGRTVLSVEGRAVTVTSDYSETPEPELVWALDADDLAVPLYRVMNVTRPEKGVFEVTALQYEPSKFDAIDSGARLETRPISTLPTGLIERPASVTLAQSVATDQGLAVTTMTITWEAVAGAIGYDVEWRKDSGNWVRLPRSSILGVDVEGIYAGTYVARVRAVGVFEVASQWRTSDTTVLAGKTSAPPVPVALTATPGPLQITLDWAFPEGAEDTLRTELQLSTTQAEADAQTLADVAYPGSTLVLPGVAAGWRRWFRARLVDRTGNVGEWTDWVDGQSSSDQAVYDEYFGGTIGSMALTETLREQIQAGASAGEAVAELTEDVQQLGQALAQEVQERTSQAQQIADDLIAEAEERAQLGEQQGAQISALQQTTDDLALEQLLLRATQGDTESQITEVRQVGQGTAREVEQLRVRSAEAESNITEIREVQADQASRMVAVETRAGDNESAISQLQETTDEQATVSQQLATRIGETESAITDLEQTADGIATRTSALEVTTQSLEDVTESQGQQLEDLDDEVAQQGSRIATTEQATVELAQRAETLETTAGEQETEINTLQQTSAEQALEAQFLRARDGSTEAQITEVRQVGQGTARRVEQLVVESGENRALIDQEAQVRADETGALAELLQQLQAATENAQAAVEVLQQAKADLDGQLSALVSIKAQTTVGGRNVMAGLTVGVEGEEQESAILAFAQRFAIIDEVSGELIYPFVVEGGQVFINSAVIGQAFIRELIVGMRLESEATDPDGNPLILLDFATGEFALRGVGTDWSTEVIPEGIRTYEDDELRTALGNLDGLV